MLLAVGGVMTFGFWKIGKGIREQKYVNMPYLYMVAEVCTGAGS
jgi:hypothetical protein